MGLGPHGTFLLARMGRSASPISLEALILDREARGQARMIARIQYAKKHKAKVKPLAPVEAMYKKPGKLHQRWWVWIGETILSKELYKDVAYTSEAIRAAGFKLPKLPTKGDKKDEGEP